MEDPAEGVKNPTTTEDDVKLANSLTIVAMVFNFMTFFIGYIWALALLSFVAQAIGGTLLVAQITWLLRSGEAGLQPIPSLIASKLVLGGMGGYLIMLIIGFNRDLAIASFASQTFGGSTLMIVLHAVIERGRV